MFRLKTKIAAIGVVVVALLSIGTTAVPASAAGYLVQFKNWKTGDCLDARDNGDDVYSIECNQDAGKEERGWQIWRIEPVPNHGGLYYVHNVYWEAHGRGIANCLFARRSGADGVELGNCWDARTWWYIDGGRLRSMSRNGPMIYDAYDSLDITLTSDMEPRSGWNQWLCNSFYYCARA